jgi:hypothetical protein
MVRGVMNETVAAELLPTLVNVAHELRRLDRALSLFRSFFGNFELRARGS